jgi:Ca-activated chloride channel homolog
MIRSFKLLLLLITCNSYAFTWQDLWLTKDQQGERLMQQGQFKKAQATFNEPAWRASAAYRSGDYQKAAQSFSDLQSEQGYYNQGNALAHLGKYEEAIKAYDKAIALNPTNKDALHNRRLLDELLKKQKEKQANSQQNKEQQTNNQQKDKQPSNQDQQDQQSQSNKDNQKKSSNKDKQGQQDNNQQHQDQPSQHSEKNPNQRDKESNSQTSENKQKQNNKDKDTLAKQNKQKPDKQTIQEAKAMQSPAEREEQQAKEQWLRLIPDDPGGLLREKFLRDYIRRQHGWHQ